MAVPRKRSSLPKLTRLYKVSNKRLNFTGRFCFICYNKLSFSHFCERCLKKNQWVYYKNIK